MKLSHLFIGKKRAIAQLLKKGYLEETQNNLDAAYEIYSQAASLGSGKAMVAIGNLYTNKQFRMVEQSNLAELILQGIPVFPWNLITKTVPDAKTALEWFRKAAELEDPQGCAVAGAMLCEGSGCPPDLEKGVAYLKKALALGVEEVRPLICIYETQKDISLSDEKYEEKLREFTHAVELNKPERFDLYSVLKGGTERQLARLGYILITRRNLNDPKYLEFKYLSSPMGIPYIPCCAKRGNWSSFVRVDLNAFSSDDVLLTFATDIHYSFFASGRLKPIGSAVYRSPAFGWLGEIKNAMVFKIDRQYLPQQEDMNRFIEAYHLHPKEYEDENAAFIVENGEKEYSAEIAAITDGKMDVLYRYTIGGFDMIESSFEPKLMELTLDSVCE